MAEKDSFKLEQFGGQLPAWDDRLLPLGQAASSLNGYLFSGALTGWRAPQFLRNHTNPAAKTVYRVPTLIEARATATLLFSFNPVEGDTVFIGEETYKFTATVTNAFDVKIGASAAISVANLFAALTLDNGKVTNEGTLYANGTIANDAIDQSSPTTKNTVASNRITIVAPDFGAAFNTTVVSTASAGRMQWQYNNLATSTLKGGVNRTFDSAISGSATWLEFVDPYTDVMRSPVVDDQFDRYYFASSSLPPMYNTHARIDAGQSPWLLGVPAPGCAPTVAVTGGTDAAQLGFPNSTSGNTGAPGANTIYLIPITPTGAMILNDVSGVTASADAALGYAAVLYSDLSGSPHELLNVGTIGSGATAGGTIASAFVNPTGLLMNVQYWIGFTMNSAVSFQQADDTGSAGVVSLNTYTNGPPEILTNLAVGFPDLQVWGDLTNTSVLEARSYAYTYVTEYDEESPPSPPTLLTGWSNGTWTVGLFTPPPDQLGDKRNIKTTRIYRTISAAGGQTTYFHVADVPVDTASYTDIVDDSIIVNNFQLGTQLFFPPPEGLQSMLSMPNGMTVGFKGNEIWFSEPYFPHAWPPSYVLTTEFPIIGLGVSGTTVVAATSSNPYIASGVSPGSMSLFKIPNAEPCTSRGSVIGNSDGVYYCSPNGLVLVTQAGVATNTTDGWITSEKWQALVPGKNIQAIFLASSYFAFGSTVDGTNDVAKIGFTIELNSVDQQSFTIWPQPGGHRLGFNKLSSPQNFDIDNVLTDPWTGQGILLQNGQTYFYNFAQTEPVMVPFKWRSKLYQQNAKNNYEAMRIFFTVPPGTPALNAVRNTKPTSDPSWNTLAPDQYGIVRVFADDVLVTAREIRKPNELLRIISGFKAFTWQWEFEGRVTISNVKLATSVKELAKL